MALLEPVTLEGGLVRLVPLMPDHWRPLVEAARAGGDTFSLTSVPTDEAGMQEYVGTALDEQRAGRALPFATIEEATGDVVGSTRLANAEYWSWPRPHRHLDRRDAPDAVEIGWTWLTAAAQRTGINREAKLLMLGHAFDTWGVRRVTIKTDHRNTRSRRAIEALGAELDGVLRCHKPGADGRVRDSAMYSILAAEWPAVRARVERSLRGRPRQRK